MNDRTVVGTIMLIIISSLCVTFTVGTLTLLYYATNHPGANLQAAWDLVIGSWSTMLGVVIGFIAGRAGANVQALRDAAKESVAEPVVAVWHPPDPEAPDERAQDLHGP